jgi:hypothetical protein
VRLEVIVKEDYAMEQRRPEIDRDNIEKKRRLKLELAVLSLILGN